MATYHAESEGAAYYDDWVGRGLEDKRCLWRTFRICTGYIYSMCYIVGDVGLERAQLHGLDRPTEECDRRDQIDEARKKTGMERHEGTCRIARERDGIAKEKSRNVTIAGESKGESREKMAVTRI